MLYIYSTLLLIINSLWLTLNFFALPGNWLIIITTCLFAWWYRQEGVFSIYTLIAVTILAAGGELVEFFAGMGGAKKAGSSWAGAFAAIIGALIGGLVATFIVPIPLFGTIIGACAGAGLATYILEMAVGREARHSVRSGLGSGLGALLGISAKFVIGVAIWLIIAVGAFWN